MNEIAIEEIGDLNPDEDLSRRNFITENKNNIQSLEKRVKKVMKQKSEMELKKMFGFRGSMLMEKWRSKSCSRYGSRSNRRKKKSKNDQFNRPQSPNFHEMEEPETFVQSLKDVLPNGKITSNKKKNLKNMRDFGCQSGDSKRTFFFPDGSNINLYIPSEEKTLNSSDKSGKQLVVVPSRYLIVKKKIIDNDNKEENISIPIKKDLNQKKTTSKEKKQEITQNVQRLNKEQHQLKFDLEPKEKDYMDRRPGNDKLDQNEDKPKKRIVRQEFKRNQKIKYRRNNNQNFYWH